MVPRNWRLPAAVLVVALLTGTGFAQSERQEDKDARAWLEAVRTHEPGLLDDPAREIAAWPWERLSPVFDRIRNTSGDNLLKAAGLYLDISIHLSRSTRPVYPTRGGTLETVDGRVLNTGLIDSQIWWARHLVNLLLRRRVIEPEHRTAALHWYRDATRVFAGRLQFADLEWHLEDAGRQFAGDPGVLYDRGCLAEALATPMIQHATAAFADTSAPSASRSVRFPHLGAEQKRHEAERYYRESIAAGPSAEARVRLGWLLVQRGQAREALGHLEAGATDPDPVVRYYSRLVLGRALADLGDHERAITSYGAALDLYAEAQAPHLGISQVEMARGRAQAARAALGRLVAVERVRDDRTDPWWVYDWCRGRDFEDPRPDTYGLDEGSR